MDDKRFDDLVRTLLSPLGRRGIVAGLLSGLLASLLPREIEAKNRRRKRRRKRRRRRSRFCIPDCTNKTCGPNGCGGSCGRCGKRRICLNGTCMCRDSDCGNGLCCNANAPQCCPPTTQNPNGSCTRAGRVCCTSEQGGGSCPPERPQCCPVTTQNPRGLCVGATEVCCSSQEGGGWCPPGLPTCCPPTALLPRGTCCAAGLTCCDAEGQCDGGKICNAGCCVSPETPPGSQSGIERQESASREKS